jgi:hypothetical protein
VILRLANVSP